MKKIGLFTFVILSTITVYAISNAEEFNTNIQKRIRERRESAKKLSELGKMLLIYANYNQEKYPSELSKLKDYDKDEMLDWAIKNVEFTGADKSVTIAPDEIIAYDRIMLNENPEGTNVLYNDCHVAFEKADLLKEKGFVVSLAKQKAHIKIEARILFVSESFLTNLKDANIITDVNCGELLNEQQSDFVLRSAQSHRDAKMLTAPGVTVLDGEGATISITKDVNCITGYRQAGRFPFAKSRPIYKTKTAGLIFKVDSKLEQNGCIKLNTDLTYTNIEPKGIKEQKKCRFPIIETVQSKSEVMIPSEQTLMIVENKITEKFDCKKGEAKFRYIVILIKAKEINPAEKQTNKCGN